MSVASQADRIARRMFAAEHPGENYDSAPRRLVVEYEKKALDLLAAEKPSLEE